MWQLHQFHRTCRNDPSGSDPISKWNCYECLHICQPVLQPDTQSQACGVQQVYAAVLASHHRVKRQLSVFQRNMQDRSRESVAGYWQIGFITASGTQCWTTLYSTVSYALCANKNKWLYRHRHGSEYLQTHASVPLRVTRRAFPESNVRLCCRSR